MDSETSAGTETLTETRADSGERERLRGDELDRGTGVGRYLVAERLGAGGMGVVYAAVDPELGRRVAIKLLHARYGGETGQARLLREAQALARVRHPRVVVVHDVGIHDGRVFLAMEYVEGRTLRAFLAEDGHPLERRLELLIAAGEGLAAAHQVGLVHRDFKPDNVMIGANAEVKVMDFGLARAADPDALISADDLGVVLEPTGPTARISGATPLAELTEAGAVMGTPAYMAPELLAGRPADALSDQFAFGVTAYQAVFGVRPFAGDNLSALTLAALEGEFVDPKQRAPAWLGRVIRRALAADPNQRWPDLEAMLAALRDDPVRRRRRRWIRGAALGLSAGIGASLTWWLARPGETPGEDACAELTSELDGLWDASARERLAAALGEQPTGRSTIELLDRYAAEWDAASLANCRTTRVELRQSERVHELRRGCLRQGRAAFEQLLAGLLAHPDARARAVEAAARLPELAACDDVAALELAPPLPEDPRAREQIAAVHDELAAIDALLELDQAGEALARAQALVREIEALAHRPLTAELALALGRALVVSDALGPGVAELRRAYFEAMASGHARAQASAAAELIYTVGYVQQDHAAGREWAEHGQAIVARVERGGLIEADMLHALGVLREASGDHRGSLDAYVRAYELRASLLPAEHPDLARSLNALGNANHSLGDLDAAREFHQRALDLRRELYGPEHRAVAGSLNNLSLVFEDAGELDRARATLAQAVAALEHGSNPHADGLCRALTNLADVERKLGALDRARELELRSLALRRASVGDEHPEVADSIVSLARIARDQGRLDEAEAHARDGLARLQRDFGPSHPETFAATLTLATVLEARGQLAGAAALLAAALAESQTDQLFPRDRAEAKALLERVGEKRR